MSYSGAGFRILSTADSNIPKSQTTLPTEQDTLSNQSTPVVILGLDGDNSYSPNPIEIKIGQTVTWYNGDAISHTVTSGRLGNPDEGSQFDSNAIIPNQYYSLAFDLPGEFRYYCIYHPSMVGDVIVK